jgi:hypothetical protein
MDFSVKQFLSLGIWRARLNVCVISSQIDGIRNQTPIKISTFWTMIILDGIFGNVDTGAHT